MAQEKPTHKKRVQSKSKGNRFELIVSKLMEMTLPPMKFMRTPGSGARVGGVNFGKIGHNFSQQSLNIFVGDIVCTNEDEIGKRLRVNIECKNYANVETVSNLLGNSKIIDWYAESEVDSKKTGKIPVLIFKWNRTDIFIASEFLPDEVTKLLMVRDDGSKIKIGLLTDALKIPEFWIEN